jgi:hypothetical protein
LLFFPPIPIFFQLFPFFFSHSFASFYIFLLCYYITPFFSFFTLIFSHRFIPQALLFAFSPPHKSGELRRTARTASGFSAGGRGGPGGARGGARPPLPSVLP